MDAASVESAAPFGKKSAENLITAIRKIQGITTGEAVERLGIFQVGQSASKALPNTSVRWRRWRQRMRLALTAVGDNRVVTAKNMSKVSESHRSTCSQGSGSGVNRKRLEKKTTLRGQTSC
jgi:NAD-dependent DNA ligase